MIAYIFGSDGVKCISPIQLSPRRLIAMTYLPQFLEKTTTGHVSTSNTIIYGPL